MSAGSGVDRGTLREVSFTEFFAVIGQRSQQIEIVGRFPYTSIHYDRGRREVGRIVDEVPPGKGLAESRYFLQVG